MESHNGAPGGAVGLFERYAGLALDIDGVLVRGGLALPGAPETLAELRRRGRPYVLVTNNASRTPAQIAGSLGERGFAVAEEEILSSPTAAARLLEPGTRCLVIGMDGLRTALAQRGCAFVDAPEEADAVVVGWDRNLVWDDLRRATIAIRRGARFIATNRDSTFPAAGELWPGNGATVAALVTASGREPEVAGKPEPALFRAAAERLPAGPLLMVGDRLDTDLAGAHALGWDTALVLTGVTAPEAARTGQRGAASAESRPAEQPRPTWVLQDVRGLLAPPPT